MTKLHFFFFLNTISVESTHPCVGNSVGKVVGASVGDTEGALDGASVGEAVGTSVGDTEGDGVVGESDGDVDGVSVLATLPVVRLFVGTISSNVSAVLGS